MKKRVIKTIEKHIDHPLVIEKPKDISFGHFATPIAFSLAKEYRKSPIIIAQELSKEFNKEDIFESVEAVKGYINFKLSEDFLDEYASWAINNEKEYGKDKQKESALLEYVSANPTGPLHIGHARGAVIGDSLYRIGKHLGYDIKSEYYVNDAGNQIHLLGLSVFLAGRENVLKADVEWPEEFYRGEYIIGLAEEAAKELGKAVFEDESNINDISLWAKDKMLELIKANLLDVGIEFENFVSEKELHKRWEESFQKLRSKQGAYEENGKIWLKSTQYGDEKDRVVVREDGRSTYLAGDIVYHDDKFKRGYQKYINIWGADHHGYIARVKAAVKFLGFDENDLEVILAQMVSLLKGGEPYKMSKRSGNFILMSDVVKEIGSDALRFIFLSKKSDTHLEFDVDMFAHQDSSNPVYYINYAHARINQVFEKSGKSVGDISKVKLIGLNEDAKNLLFFSLLLPEIIEDAFSSRQLQKLTEYLKNLAAALHKFYNEHKVVGSENEDMYLKLFAMVAVSIRVGLGLIGIEAKKRM